LSSFHKIEKILIWGSRAKGTFKPNSDVDLAIMNIIDVDKPVKLNAALNESNIPFKIDLVPNT